MKKILKSLVEVAYGAKVYANHTAIKGNKSGGKTDGSSTYKHWQKEGGNGTHGDVN